MPAAHPASSSPMGLGRFGPSVLLDIVEGDDPSTSVAVFQLLAAGEIDLATVATAAAAYRGTFDFGGTIGPVSANVEMQFVNVDVDADIHA